MSLRSELDLYVSKTFRNQWSTRDGRDVPDPEDVKLANDAVKLSGTVLYADLAESTAMVDNYNDFFAAEVYKAYLYCAAKIIRSMDGTITSYDGDRVMAVYVGGSKNSNAVKTALKINYAVSEIIQPALKAQYPTSPYELRHRVGVDTSGLFVAQTGIRGSNDLVWVGPAANHAAKLATLKPYDTYITVDVYEHMDEAATIGNDGRNMWTNLGTSAIGRRIYGSDWWWSVS